VLADHVLDHASADAIERAFGEIRRVGRLGGDLDATLISVNDTKRLRFGEQVAAGEAVALEPLTVRCPDEREGDVPAPPRHERGRVAAASWPASRSSRCARSAARRSAREAAAAPAPTGASWPAARAGAGAAPTARSG
jgi:hypothetical protein